MEPDISVGYSIINAFFGTFNDTGNPTCQSSRHLYFNYLLARSLAENTEFSAYIRSQLTPYIISDLIRQIQTKTRCEITADLLYSVPDGSERKEEAVNTLLTFIVRVWLMCRIGDFPGEPRQGQISVPWPDNSTLSHALESHFHRSTTDTHEEQIQLEKSFKARNLERFGGIRVIWTSNLPDHLRLYDPSDDNHPYQLLIFHHVRLLEYHRKSEIFLMV
ncbi:uncharacterized protein N7458_001471 [Penicillium daleae]|uniref:Uncharacterized protein n=1 Tax=Penicillium daleae TaxID=63821 RepID=A0AAD6CBQ8_9EURO|nr:uncharacterized protein N7458_001471 [Penicillium daleae]KAJ5459919.1 hypothetical protein N7458_001471 [Penicillium daleae]